MARDNSHLPEKANKILNGILVVLVLIAVKVWHLSVVQHDKKLLESKGPQRRVVIERSERATIVDRFDVPLAINKVQYNVSVCYSPIRSIARSSWKKEEKKRIRCFPRKEYITDLSHMLARELHLDAEWIEDMIHSKSALLGNVPCLIKQNITEEQYFRLKMLEKDWPGVVAEIGAQRCYPLGEIGQEIVGYIGPISSKEYGAIVREMASLRAILSTYEEGEKPQEIIGYTSIEKVAKRLEELEKKAYRINDFVGKIGVEAACDEELRGLCGKQIYLADIKGNFCSKLEGSEDAVEGSKVVLTLSSELQSYALKLLAEYENEPASAVPPAKRSLVPQHQPWIKGGAIVVMNPNNGEVYALASSPTFDPSDFVRSGSEFDYQKNRRVHQWLETEQHIANIWDRIVAYSRPRYDNGFCEEKLLMSWNHYLNFILPKQSKVIELLKKHSTIEDALFVQGKVDELVALCETDKLPSFTSEKILNLLFCGEHDKAQNLTITLQEKAFFDIRRQEIALSIDRIKQELSPYFSSLESNYDKCLLTDLYRIVVDGRLFGKELRSLVGNMELETYRELSADFVAVKEAVRSIVKEIFYENEFKQWHHEHFKDYLAQKREEEEREKKKYARPYIEYLEMAKKQLFNTFWAENHWELLSLFLNESASSPSTVYQTALLSWKDELKKGAHRGIEWVANFHSLRKGLEKIPSSLTLDFLKTLRSFKELDRPLIGKYPQLHGRKESHLAAAFYPTYGFGYARSSAFRQAATIGSIFKLVPSYEALRQRYLRLKEGLSSLQDLNPLTIIDDKHLVHGKKETWNVGYTLDGKVIPMYYRGGRLPRSDHYKVGRVDLAKALEVSSNPYFALISGDVLEDPEDLCHAAGLLGFGEKTGIDLPGEYAGYVPQDITYNRAGLYAMSIGQHSLVGTPLQTALMLSCIANGGSMLKPQIVKQLISPHAVQDCIKEVRWQVFMPKPIQNILLSAMQQVIMGDKGTARSIRKMFDPALVKQIIGKTSTSEVIERVSLDGENGQMKLKHVWFGAISYETDDFSHPELVVVVYLRYGGWGKDAAPLAVEMVKKWREIKMKTS